MRQRKQKFQTIRRLSVQAWFESFFEGIFMRMNAKLGTAVLVAAGLLMVGCDEKKPTTPATTQPGAKTVEKGHDHDHDHDHGHDHDHAKIVNLGPANIGTFVAIAARGEGKIVAGNESAVTVSVAPAAGTTAKATAVRFWVGTQDAKGSLKAKGEVEDPKKPNDWHEHVEIPKPLPEGSKLWVEIVDDKGVEAVGSYDLK
jgi:hypothetical protein